MSKFLYEYQLITYSWAQYYKNIELIKQKICDEIYTKMCIKMWLEYVLKHVLK